MGFAWGVSSHLTSNAFIFWFGNVFQVQRRARRRGHLQKVQGLYPTSARVEAGKGGTIGGMTLRSADYVKT
jgi:hypothetical protein